MVGLHVAIILLLILLNGVLAMSELAIVSARPGRLQQKADEGSSGAADALSLAEDPSKFLSTVQIGITLIGIINGAFGGATLSGPVGRALSDVPVIGQFSNAIAGPLVVLVITYLSLIVGELVPKQLALQRAETFASLLAPLMKTLAKITAPIVWFLSVSNDFVLKLLRADQIDEPAVTEEEIKVMLMQATDAGIFERAEQEMVAGVFGLGDRTAGELMTPRHAIVFLDLAESHETNVERMRSTTFQMYPVCDGSTDNVVGMINTRNLWDQQINGEEPSIRKAMRPALFVPEISPVLSALKQMRDTKATAAIIIDEYGGVEGLITINDVLSGVIDEIGSHHGDDPDNEGVDQQEDGTWIAEGVLGAHEVRELFDIKELDGEEAGRFETIGGFILDQLGHIPVAGEFVEVEGHRIEVVSMDGHRIDKVRIVPPSSSQEPAA